MADALRRWGLWVAVAGILVGVWLPDDPPPAPQTRVEQVRVITDRQIRRLERIVRAMTTTTVPLSPAQQHAVTAAQDLVDDVTAGGVSVVHTTPGTTTTTTTPPTTTTSPPTSPPTTFAHDLLTVPTVPPVLIPPPVTVTVP